MVRKLKTGEIYYWYTENSFKEKSECHKLNDVWVDENNFEHNENGLPSTIRYKNQEKFTKESADYRIHGKVHNLFGPAIIWYLYNTKIDEFYFLYGKELNKREWEIEKNRIKMLEE